MVETAQAAAHALERLLQVAERVALARHLERARVVALADALGALDERVDRALQLAHRAPRQRRAEQRAGGGEGERQPQRQAGARGGGGVQPPGEARLRHRRCLHQRHGEGGERLRRDGAGDVLDQGAHRRAGAGAERARSERGAALPAEERAAGEIGDREAGDGVVVHEGLQAPHGTGGVAGAHRAGDRVGGVRGDAAGAGLQLRIDALARGVLGQRAERAGVGGVADQQQGDDRGRSQEHHQEGGPRVLELEGRGSHVRTAQRGAGGRSPELLGIHINRRPGGKATGAAAQP